MQSAKQKAINKKDNKTAAEFKNSYGVLYDNKEDKIESASDEEN